MLRARAPLRGNPARRRRITTRSSAQWGEPVSGKRVTRIPYMSQKAHRLLDSKGHSQRSLSWRSLMTVLTTS
jgi:hypothetical protein